MPSLNQVTLVNRFRPERSGANKLISSIQVKNDQSLEIAFPVRSSYYRSGITKGDYVCSCVVNSNVSQDDFYHRFGEKAVDSLFKGQNALFLAYGITGGGKTFTTVGSIRNEGLLQHSCKQLLDFVFQRSTVHTRYVVKFSVAAIYDEQSVDLLGYSFFTFLNSSTKATSKGIFSGGRIPHFSETELSSYSDFLSILIQCQNNQHTFEARESKNGSDCHTIYSLKLYRYNQETCLSVLQFADLAGCENESVPSQYGYPARITKHSASSLKLLLDCIQQYLTSGVSSFSQSVLTTLLKDHFVGNTSSVSIIHCISNQYDDLEATVNSFEQLKPLSRLICSSPLLSKTSTMCSECLKNYEELEEEIRDKVITEIFLRKRSFSIATTSVPSEPINEFISTIQGSGDDTEVHQIIQAYDKENRDLLVELAEAKRRVQELEEQLEDKEARIVQLNSIVSILQKSQPCWNRSPSSCNSSASPPASPMFQPKHVLTQSTPPASPKHVLTQSTPPASPKHVLTQSTPPASPKHVLTQSTPPASPRVLLSSNSQQSPTRLDHLYTRQDGTLRGSTLLTHSVPSTSNTRLSQSASPPASPRAIHSVPRSISPPPSFSRSVSPPSLPRNASPLPSFSQRPSPPPSLSRNGSALPPAFSHTGGNLPPPVSGMSMSSALPRTPPSPSYRTASRVPPPIQRGLSPPLSPLRISRESSTSHLGPSSPRLSPPLAQSPYSKSVLPPPQSGISQSRSASPGLSSRSSRFVVIDPVRIETSDQGLEGVDAGTKKSLSTLGKRTGTIKTSAVRQNRESDTFSTLADNLTINDLEDIIKNNSSYK